MTHRGIIVRYSCSSPIRVCKNGKNEGLSGAMYTHQVPLISISVAETLILYCLTTDTGLLHRLVCLLSSQLLQVLILATRGGVARLS